MYLVDTSVWIDLLKEKRNKATEYFREIIEHNTPFALSGIIYQEILQGSNSAKDFETSAKYLASQRFVHPQESILTYQAAAKIYMDCRKRGITIRSTNDCLIAQLAIEHNLILLHCDNDYLQIKKIAHQLKLFDDLVALRN